MAKIFVTGGNGFIGSRVVRRLLQEGYEVRCLLRPGANSVRLGGLEFERVPGDVRDIESLHRGMMGATATIHLASISSWQEIDSPLSEEVIVGGTRNLLSVAAALNDQRVVFVSSVLAVNGSNEPQVFDEDATWTVRRAAELPYSLCKRAAEELCRRAARAGLPVVIVNPAEVYGPDDTALITAGNLADFARSNPVLVCNGGTCIAHVDDVALGIIRAVQRGRPGERYILAGDNMTVGDLARLCLKILGKKSWIVTVPNPILRAIARLGLLFSVPLPFNPRVIPYATLYWYADAGKARRELDVEFRSARDTLEPTLQWLKEAGHIAANRG